MHTKQCVTRNTIACISVRCKIHYPQHTHSLSRGTCHPTPSHNPFSHTHTHTHTHTLCVCVCVCVRERERERERVQSSSVNWTTYGYEQVSYWLLGLTQWLSQGDYTKKTKKERKLFGDGKQWLRQERGTLAMQISSGEIKIACAWDWRVCFWTWSGECMVDPRYDCRRQKI